MRDQDDRVHRAWDIFIGLCATATALMIPVGLVFRLAGETFVTYINWFITVVYVVDIGVRYHHAQQPAPALSGCVRRSRGYTAGG